MLYTDTQGAPRTKQYHCFLCGAPKIFLKSYCYNTLKFSTSVTLNSLRWTNQSKMIKHKAVFYGSFNICRVNDICLWIFQ